MQGLGYADRSIAQAMAVIGKMQSNCTLASYLAKGNSIESISVIRNFDYIKTLVI